MFSHLALARNEVQTLPKYNAGVALDRFRETYGIDCRAKLDSNENPYGPSPAALAAVTAKLPAINRYPDAANLALRRKIGAINGVAPDRVIIGNGSEDLINVIYRTALRPGDRVLTVCPSFGLHEFSALACGANVVKIPFNRDWSFPLDQLMAEIRNGAFVVILSSPSNPAGPFLSQAELERLASAVPRDCLLVLDEAYIEYVDGYSRYNAAKLLARKGKSWIVLRTFSKAYGLAGARIGYGVCFDSEYVELLHKVRNPFAVNALAVAAADAALEDREHVEDCVQRTVGERERVARGLKAAGFAVAPSHTNFLFFDTGTDAVAFAEALRRRGILIKAWLEEPYRSFARVTIGLPEENDIFLAAVAAAKAA